MTTKEAPRFVKCGQLAIEETDKVAGYWGVSPDRQGLGFVTERDSKRHRICALNAYAISVSVLKKLDALHISYIFVGESDTGRVYEFELDQFTEEGELVNVEFAESWRDTQRYVPVEEAYGRWDSGLSEFYLSTPVDEVKLFGGGEVD